LLAQQGRVAILDYPAILDHHNPWETQGLADIVGDANQRAVLPVLAGLLKKLAALGTIQAAKWFVQYHQPCIFAEKSAAKPHTLPFPARYQSTALSQHRFHPFWSVRQHRRLAAHNDREGSFNASLPY
jgi:hypothetical protein